MRRITAQLTDLETCQHHLNPLFPKHRSMMTKHSQQSVNWLIFSLDQIVIFRPVSHIIFSKSIQFWKIVSDAKQRDIDIVHAGNVRDLANSPFKPYGSESMAYWDLMTNNSPKLHKIVKKIAMIPTSSSSLERVFSQLSHKVGKNRANHKCESLCILHQSSVSSLQFIDILKNKFNSTSS